jgi:predicted AAA+ superfamily ATPase
LSIRRELRLVAGDARATFLWGPRKVGKSTFLRQHFPRARWYDLLDSDLRTRLTIRPGWLREEVLAERPRIVVIDEIQKVPALLDEVHALIESTRTRFVLSGSSARKVRRGAANLLGGRAVRHELFPLTVHEIARAAGSMRTTGAERTIGLSLERLVNHGAIPSHYLAVRPEAALRSYVLDYVAEEIHAEALVRNVPAFARFLDALALTHGRLVNYANLAREAGVSPKTAREYFQILEDTLLGHRLAPWRRSRSRRLIETEKFYLFDVGLVRALAGMRRIEAGSDEFGRSFEHLMIEDVRARLAYAEKHLPLTYWRTSTGLEVDLVIGDLDLAIEFKARRGVGERDAQGLRALCEDQRVRRAMLVSLDTQRRRLANGIEVWPWLDFCEALAAGEWLP